MGAIETIFHAEERPWWHRRGIAVACVIGGLGVAAVVATVIIVVASNLGPLGTFLTAVVTPLAILIGLVCGIFRIAVRRLPTTRARVLPGAVVTVTLWALVSALFSLYVRTLARFATLYGGLATVAMLLFWLWLLALALLAGAEINAALEEESDPASQRHVRPTVTPRPQRQQT
jgi:membrane protein